MLQTKNDTPLQKKITPSGAYKGYNEKKDSSHSSKK